MNSILGFQTISIFTYTGSALIMAIDAWFQAFMSNMVIVQSK